jgi:gamma-glutamylcyclotransferase
MGERMVKYFSYGSNMYTPRLRYRVPSCSFVTIANLSGRQLHFHKQSKDGSSKCDLFHTGVATDVVWGVVFDTAEAEKQDLDRAEGLRAGYNDQVVVLTKPNGEQIEAVTFVADATAIVKGIAPFTWYKDFVAGGAQEHGLPPDYIATSIGPVLAVQDPKPEREQEERAKVRN